MQVDPENAFAYYNRGISYDRRGDLQQAIANFSHAIQLQVTQP